MPFANLSRQTLAFLSLAPALITGAGIFLALPWLKVIPNAFAMAIVSAATVLMIAVTLYFANLTYKRQDEVERESTRFGTQHGVTAGYVAIALLLCIPPVHDFIIATANNLAIATKGNTDKAPMFAFIFGIAALTIAQSIGILVFHNVWWRSKSR